MSDFDWSEFAGGGGAPTFGFDAIGDALAGTVASVERVDGKFGVRPVIHITPERQKREAGKVQPGEDGTVAVWCSSVGLRAAAAEAAPQVGDKVGIRFVGTQDTGQPSPMKKFEFKILERAQPAAAADDEEPVYDESEPF